MRVASSSWRSFQVIARWSLSVTGAADRCAHLSPPLSITAPCRPEISGASALCLGTLCLARSCVRDADMHDLCLWLLSLELAQLSGRGTMVTLSSEYATDRCAELSPFQGLAFGTLCLVCSRVRAETHDLCVWLWRASCGAAFRSWHGGHVRWPVLLIAELSCRPYRASLRHVGQRCHGLQRLGILCFGSLVRQSR